MSSPVLCRYSCLHLSFALSAVRHSFHLYLLLQVGGHLAACHLGQTLDCRFHFDHCFITKVLQCTLNFCHAGRCQAWQGRRSRSWIHVQYALKHSWHSVGLRKGRHMQTVSTLTQFLSQWSIMPSSSCLAGQQPRAPTLR